MNTYQRRGVVYQIIPGDEENVVRVVSPVSEGVQTVALTKDQTKRFLEWLAGSGLIQTVLPDLSPDDRNVLLCGMGPQAWDKAFSKGS